MKSVNNKYHPQLLGMTLERATGMPVTSYLQTKIWDKLGMDRDTNFHHSKDFAAGKICSGVGS